MSEHAWAEDRSEVLRFARILVLNELLQDRDAVLYYFEKPQKWTDEYHLWAAYSRPVEDDPLYPSFVSALDAVTVDGERTVQHGEG